MKSAGIFVLWTVFSCGHCFFYSLFSKNEDIRCANAISKFGMDILKIHSKHGYGNIIFSPWSIAMSLGNLFIGAKGTVQYQLNQMVFSSIKKDKDLYTKVSQLMDTLSGMRNKKVLKSSNMLFISHQVYLKHVFVGEVKKYLQAKIFHVNFMNEEETVEKINSVIQRVDKVFVNVVERGDFFNNVVTPKMVLASAMYFTGKLAPKFHPIRSKDRNFIGTNGIISTVRMMKAYDSGIFYEKNSDVEFVGMPYNGKKLVLYIVKPMYMTLPEFELKISHKQLMKWFCNAKARSVMVNIPQLFLKDNFELNGAMKAMKMTEMFKPTSDFSPMYYNSTVDDGLFSVSSLIHSAFLQLSETPVSTYEFPFLIKSLNDPEFTADSPFLFAVIETSKKAMLFLGHYVGPA